MSTDATPSVGGGALAVEEPRSRFDWYELTVDDSEDGRLAKGLAIALPGIELRTGRGRYGYGTCTELVRGADQLAAVYEHSARRGEVHVVTSSAACDELVPILRRLWPVHRVSRADSAIDLVADFDQLDQVALDFAGRRGLSHRLIVNSDGGATRYLGAPSSEVRLRIYKKTEQLRAMHPERAGDVQDGLVRIELQVRPGKRLVKERAAGMSADDLWGLSEWGRQLADELLQLDVDRVSTHFRRPSSWERSRWYLGLQYGALVRDLAGRVGRDAALVELAEVFQL